MKKLLVVVLVLLVGVAALGSWRGWFSVTKEGTVDVQGDPAKFKQDKEAFTKTVGENTKALKSKIASLWKNTEGLKGDDKAHAEKELTELEKKHERIEKQLKELEVASSEKFESIKQDLSKTLKDVEQKIEELTQKLAKEKDK
jgi:predicted  nucleic acid-binding Zn-ribbon protein